MCENEESGRLQERKVFMERIYKELQTVEEFRFKFSTMKIFFVAGLLGIGAAGLKLNNTHEINLYPVVYFAPLVAILFDILGMAATVNIVRINAFLRNNGGNDEKAWQCWLHDHSLLLRELLSCPVFDKDYLSFSWLAAPGFTFLTFPASIMILCHGAALERLCVAFVWFPLLFVVWLLFRCWEYKVKKGFET
jgi:hypothetical protein